MPEKIQVLIGGAEPVGQALAIELGHRGIDCLVLEKNPRIGVAPRAKTTNVRTREHFRRWGIVDALRAASPFGVNYPSNIAFTTRMSGAMATGQGPQAVFNDTPTTTTRKPSMNEVLESPPQTASKAVISPVRLAHVVLRSSQFDALVDWYKTVLGAKIAFSDGNLAFLAYDEEHHRIAVLNIPGLQRQPDGMTGVHHMAFTYASLSDLVTTYERLEKLGIRPVTCINHGPTTSMYYADPDGNQVELQIDNYDTVEEAGEFFYSPAFAKNPIGVDFEAAELVRRFHAGEDQAAIKKRPDSGARGLDTLNLR